MYLNKLLLFSIAERLEKLWPFRQPSELYDDRDGNGQPGLDQFKPGSLFHVLLLGSPFQEDPSERKLPVPRWATANRRGLICQVLVTFCSISRNMCLANSIQCTLDIATGLRHGG